MLIKQLVSYDITNYKKASMSVLFPNCSFKCDKEAGTCVCQNSALALMDSIDVSVEEIVARYKDNPLVKSLVFSGLEPFDSWEDMENLINAFREQTEDDIVIYTGYIKEEIQDKVNILSKHKNIIIKYGRFIPNQGKHFETIIGIDLTSDNQYAEKIS